jgi:hypothetical protein
VEALGQDAGDIFEQSAAGDVRERADLAAADHRQHALHIDAGRLHQPIDQQFVLIEQSRAIELPALVGGEPADER